MINFRSKATKVKKRGSAERGNFTPHGKPLDVYNWWRRNGGEPPATENFCHFWRVVVFWAPIEWVLFKIDRATGTNAKIAILISVYLGVAFAIAASWTWYFLIPVLGVPLAAAAIFGLIYGLSKIPGVARNAGTIMAVLFAFYLGTLIVWLLVLAFMTMGFWMFLVIPGILCAMAVTAGIVALLVILFGRVVEAKRDRAHQRFPNKPENDEPITKPIPPKQPGIVSRFFHGLGDFLVLVAQIIRVKKWKICPLVEFPKED